MGRRRVFRTRFYRYSCMDLIYLIPPKRMVRSRGYTSPVDELSYRLSFLKPRTNVISTRRYKKDYHLRSHLISPKFIGHKAEDSTTDSDDMTDKNQQTMERRLRPLYELLDSGNNKRVVTDAEKVLKKQPDFPCAKLLKALALIRLNKPDDARIILEDVAQDTPTDDASIQALSICYREIEDHSGLCVVLEAACKKDPSEELLTHCFMAHVRVSDFHKQHLIALNLYKTYNKSSYFGWAIASLLMKYENDCTVCFKKGPADFLVVNLAERMCDKFLGDQSAKKLEEHIFLLYIRVLEILEKWDKILQLMNSREYPYQMWDNNATHALYCKTMIKLKKQDELFQYFKSRFLENPEDYAIIKEIIDTFGKTKVDEVKAFLDDLRSNQPSRVVGLGDLLFHEHHLEKNEYRQRVIEDFEMVIKSGAKKLSFYPDMIDYFRLINEEDAEYLIEVLNPFACDKDGLYNQIDKITADVNYEMIIRDVMTLRDPLERLRRADRCLGKFLVCEDFVRQLRDTEQGTKTLKTKESDFQDLFIIIAATGLIGDYFNGGNFYHLENFLSRKEEWTCLEQSPNELKKKRSAMLSEYQSKHEKTIDQMIADIQIDEDNDLLHQKNPMFLLISAILILEYGLDTNSCNYAYRLLLSQCYSRLGALSATYQILLPLDFKHVQWDSLGYLLMYDVVTAGLYEKGMKMFASAETMYSSYKRECMEHIISTYKHNTLDKTGEFIAFGKQLLGSTQCGMVFCEKRLLDYLTCTSNFGDIKKIAEAVGKELSKNHLEKSTFYDNRDFSVIQNLAEYYDINDLKKTSAYCDMYLYKIRIALLFSITKLVTHLENLDNETERDEVIGYFRLFGEKAAEWEFAEKDIKPVVDKTHRTVFGFWPPRAHTYAIVGAIHAIQRVFGYVEPLLTATEINRPPMQNFLDVIGEDLSSMLQNLILFSTAAGPDGALNEMSIKDAALVIHYVLETISFYRIFLECAVRIDRHKLNVHKSDSSKKGKTESLTHRKMHMSWMNTLSGQAEKVVTAIAKIQIKINKLNYHKWGCKVDDIEKLLQPSFLSHLFPKYYPKLNTRLSSSFKEQTDEQKKLAQGLVDYLKNASVTDYNTIK